MCAPTIFAIGGGGFDSDQPGRSALDRFVLELTGRSRPRVCLIPTAGGDSALRVGRFMRAIAALGVEGSVLELFSPATLDFEGFLAEHDAVFVSGGSTRNLLALWREWGLDRALERVWEAGVVLSGVSAGGNCWFRRCSTDSYPGELRVLPALGWLPGDFCPHYDEESERRPTLRRFVGEGSMGPVWAVDGGAGVLYRGREFAGAFGCGGAGVTRVELTDGGVLEERWETVSLA